MSLRLLLIAAHPDDECFAFGGALALAADRGVETSVLCLTDGQAAKNRGDSSSSQNLGQMRRQEFQASCKILGVTHAKTLNYQDAQLEHEPLSKLAGDLVGHIRTLKPHVVLTFGADGGANTHADHTSVSLATTAAFHWAGLAKRFPDIGQPWQAQRLFHQTTDFFLPDRPAPLPAPWTLKLDITSAFDRKVAAFRAHTSQAPLAQFAIPLFEQHGKHELYTLMASAKPHPATQSTDMFESITG